jgi:hypothetical protein
MEKSQQSVTLYYADEN